MVSAAGSMVQNGLGCLIPVRRAPERRASLTRTETEKSHADAEDTDDYDGLKATIFEAFRVQNFSGRSNERMRSSEGVSWDGWSSRQDPASPIQSRILCGRHQSHRLAKRDRLLYGAIEVAAQEKPLAKAVTMLKRASVKKDADPEVERSVSQVTGTRVTAVTTHREVAEDLGELVLRLKELLTSDIPAAVKRGPLQQRRQREKKNSRTCVNMRMNRPHQPRLSFFYPHISEIETLTVESSVGGVRCNKLVDTESAVTLAYEKIMRDSKTLWDVLKHVIQLKTASRDELEVMNECVTEIIFVGLVTLLHTVLWVRRLSHKMLLGWDFMRYHVATAGCLSMQQGNIPFSESYAVAPLRSVVYPQPERVAHNRLRKAIKKMLPSEQEVSRNH
ncbi:hypothetical protein T10_11081 [Trichinella papuae]|uniref:Uncharacterized protein n=1 Tax=Trichinella papuae TaxID=268474 RepID=A0A0V1MG42_9BILA|nr:hypothetical protein T10_11081 [Trichinella papuae]